MSASDLVCLAGGLTVPLPAVRLLLSLEDRGVTLVLDGDSIIARPRAKLTDEDRAAIRLWRSQVVAILIYCQEERLQ